MKSHGKTWHESHGWVNLVKQGISHPLKVEISHTLSDTYDTIVSHVCPRIPRQLVNNPCLETNMAALRAPDEISDPLRRLRDSNFAQNFPTSLLAKSMDSDNSSITNTDAYPTGY